MSFTPFFLYNHFFLFCFWKGGEVSSSGSLNTLVSPPKLRIQKQNKTIKKTIHPIKTTISLTAAQILVSRMNVLKNPTHISCFHFLCTLPFFTATTTPSIPLRLLQASKPCNLVSLSHPHPF